MKSRKYEKEECQEKDIPKGKPLGFFPFADNIVMATGEKELRMNFTWMYPISCSLSPITIRMGQTHLALLSVIKHFKQNKQQEYLKKCAI